MNPKAVVFKRDHAKNNVSENVWTYFFFLARSIQYRCADGVLKNPSSIMCNLCFVSSNHKVFVPLKASSPLLCTGPTGGTITGGTFTSSPGRNCDGTPIRVTEHAPAVSARLVFTTRVRVKLGMTSPCGGRGSSCHILIVIPEFAGISCSV